RIRPRQSLDPGGYRTKLARRRGIDFQVCQELNTGLVVVGCIGNDLRMDYRAAGDTTNVAARLQQLAQPGSIVIAEPTVGMSLVRWKMQRRSAARRSALLDDFIRQRHYRGRDRQTEGLRRPAVDDQLEYRGLLDGHVMGARPLENAVHVDGRPPDVVRETRAV